MKTILGIDCSSQTIGHCVLTINNNIINFVSAGYIKPIKDGNIIDRLADTRDKIQTLIKSAKPDYIAIEDIIFFMKGASTAKTIITLTAFNRMMGLCAYDYLNKSPELFNVMSIRHGIKLDKKLPAKEEIPDLVAKHLNIKFPFEYKKNKTIKSETYDKADATAVALYYALILINKIKKKVKK